MGRGSRLWGTVAGASLVFSGCAVAQTAGAGRMFGDGASPRAPAAYLEWRHLSQKEVNCVDRALHAEGTTLWRLIERGVDPSSASVAKVRNVCRAQAKMPDAVPAAHSGAQALASATDAIANKTAGQVVTRSVPADPVVVKPVVVERTVIRAVDPVPQTSADKPATATKVVDVKPAEKSPVDKTTLAQRAPDQDALSPPLAAGGLSSVSALTGPVVVASAGPDPASKALSSEKVAVAAAERTQSAPADPAPSKIETGRVERQETTASSVEAALASLSSESRRSFIYGLISGPILFGLGGFAFLLFFCRRDEAVDAAEPVGLSREGGGSRSDMDRLVDAVLSELVRREERGHRPVARPMTVDQLRPEPAVH